MDNNNINNNENNQENEAVVEEAVSAAANEAAEEATEESREYAPKEAETAEETAEAEEEVVESKVETFVPHVEEVEDVHFNLTSLTELKKFFHSKKWKGIWDKITTGILIALMASPVLILAYIFLWFVFK